MGNRDADRGSEVRARLGPVLAAVVTMLRGASRVAGHSVALK